MQNSQNITPSAGPPAILAVLSEESGIGELTGICDTLPRQAVELSALDARVRDLLLGVFQIALPPDSPPAGPRFTEFPGVIVAHPL